MQASVPSWFFIGPAADMSPLFAVRCVRAHRAVVAGALKKLLATERKAADRVENLLVTTFWRRTDYSPVLDLKAPQFADMVAASHNPSRPCIWETREDYNAGMRTIAELPDQTLADPLVRFCGEWIHF